MVERWGVVIVRQAMKLEKYAGAKSWKALLKFGVYAESNKEWVTVLNQGWFVKSSLKVGIVSWEVAHQKTFTSNP